MKLSISPRGNSLNNNSNKINPINLVNKKYNHKSQKLLLYSKIPKDVNIQTSNLKRKRNSFFVPLRTKTDDNSSDSKRFSQESLQTKTKKFLQNYNLKKMEKIH